MDTKLNVFPDFHLHGASAPEWNQRYWQISPGVMRSSLDEWSAGGMHVFRKWMSERVLQQGGLPRGRVCFALLGGEPASAMRVQGREFHEGDLLVLRGGDDFEFHRPAGARLLSVTFDAEAFPPALRQSVVRPHARAFAALRAAIHAQLRSPQQGDLIGDLMDDLMATACDAMDSAEGAPAPRASNATAARLVRSCQEIVIAELPDRTVRIDELCKRLRTSRRTLQGSFNRVAGMSPLAYLRNLRLNAVRRRLLSSAAGEVSVSQAASEAGFDHFGHFAGGYKHLFGESPSRTKRRAR